MIDDYAERVKELRQMDKMDRYSQPIVAALVIALILIIGNTLLEVYAAKKHSEEIQAASAFASCLNGYKIEIKDVVVGCNIQKIDLVKGLQ